MKRKTINQKCLLMGLPLLLVLSLVMGCACPAAEPTPTPTPTPTPPEVPPASESFTGSVEALIGFWEGEVQLQDLAGDDRAAAIEEALLIMTNSWNCARGKCG